MPLFSARPEALQLAPYVPGKQVSEVERELGLTGVVKLASNESPLGPSPLAVAAMGALAPTAHIYPDSTASLLRQALAARVGLQPDWIFIGNGSDEILRLLAASYVRTGDRVVVPDCSFPNYRAVATLFGASVQLVPPDGDCADLTAMAGAAADGARLLFLCRPDNPTGTVFGEEEFRSLMQQVPGDMLVVVDQAYHEFTPSPFDSLALLRSFPNLILTRTFSKAYGLAGLRVGYGMARPEIWAPLTAVREPFSVNAMAQAAALAALRDEAHLDRTLAVVREGRRFLEGVCADLGLRHTPSEANFLLIDLGRPAQPVFEALLRHGVIVRPCQGFGRPTCLRVTVGLPEANRRFAAALRQVLSAPEPIDPW